MVKLSLSLPGKFHRVTGSSWKVDSPKNTMEREMVRGKEGPVERRAGKHEKKDGEEEVWKRERRGE